MDKEQLKGMVRHLLGERQAFQYLDEAITVALNAENTVVEAQKAVKVANEELAKVKAEHAKELQASLADHVKYEAERIQQLQYLQEDKARVHKECEEVRIKSENEANRRVAHILERSEELKKTITQLEGTVKQYTLKLGSLDEAIKAKGQELYEAEQAVVSAKRVLSDLKSRL